MFYKNIFYILKPIIPRKIQIFLRRILIKQKAKKYKDIWPIDENAKEKPEGWNGWPGQKKFAVILTHDVETNNGQAKCHQLMELEERLGFRSSFNFVPERYNVSPELRNNLVNRGFEVGVHGLNHDGNLYKSRKIFQDRAMRINHYLNDWKAVGFRSPSMHHNLDWLHELDIRYDASTFDTDPFEPQPDGVRTIFPFWVSNNSSDSGYVELPYTLVQDFTLFILFNANDINIWKEKVDWIAIHGGMVLVNVHPDYMFFGGKKISIDEFPAEYYENFLNYIKSEYHGLYWHALPKEVARFWKSK